MKNNIEWKSVTFFRKAKKVTVAASAVAETDIANSQ